MGGKAFKTLLPNASFPRMHPTVYNALKAQLLPILQNFYAHATVAPECPGKTDYGDLDIIACNPREGFTHEELGSALRVKCSILLGGNRISNFAIPAEAFEAVAEARRTTRTSFKGEFGPAVDQSKDEQEFYQVDVNVCADQAQLDRIVFYTSFGDLGLILGLLSQTAGLSINIFGLKLAEPLPTLPPRTFCLTTSMTDTLALLGLSMHRWQEGFATQEDIFSWVATSPFVLPLAVRFRSSDYKTSKAERLDERQMRRNFVTFLQTRELTLSPEAKASIFATPGNRDEKINAALRFFGKDQEHAALLYAGRAQKRSKDILNGTNVQDWTGVMGMPVRFVMDEVKERLAVKLAVPRHTEPSHAADYVLDWQRALLDMADEDVRALVVTVKEELQQAGKLEFDWQAAKAAKLKRDPQQGSNSGDALVEGKEGATVNVTAA